MGIVFGARHFGAKGAVVATLGMFLLPSILVLVLGVAYATFGNQPAVIDALRGMGAVAAGLIIATGVKLLTALRSNVMGLIPCGVFVVMSLIAVIVFNVRVAHALVLFGLLACVFAYLKLTAGKVR
jgi:chromate transporter